MQLVRKILGLVFCLSLAVAWSSLMAEHPRLYFSAGDLPALRAQAKGAKAVQFSNLKRWGDTHLEEAPPSSIGTVEGRHEPCFSVVTNYGLLYRLTGDRKYLDAAVRWLEALLAAPTDSQGNYHIGLFAASLAHGYDFLYNGLSASFRNRLRAKLIEVLEEARRGATGTGRGWWRGLYTHHDFWIPVAGMGIAAVCLKGEYPAADSIAQLAVDELSRAMDLIGEKGYWPEGTADWVYAMVPCLMFFDVLNRDGGPDFYQRPWMQNTARVRLMHWMPDDTYMYIGDSYPNGRYGTLGSVSAHVLMRLAGRYRDGNAQWLALREARADSLGSAGSRRGDSIRHGLAWQFLWYDPTVQPVPPDTLPLDELFPNWDTAVFRAGWGPDDPVLAFAGGHLLGRAATAAWKEGNRKLPGGLAHTHQNAGSLYLWADNKFALAPPAYGGRDGRFHSTVMVDGHGQLFKADHTGKVTAFESGSGWAMAAMNLTGAYPEQVELDLFTRTLVFLKPRTILLLDKLVTRDGDKNYIRRYESLLHTDPASAHWVAGRDSLAAIPNEPETGKPLLKGRVFPSARYYFERQMMDSPEGRPRDRALSVTLIGQVPVEVRIPMVLHAPAPGENTGWLGGVSCASGSRGVWLTVPEECGHRFRAVAFTTSDTLEISPDVAARRPFLVVGLTPGQRYRLESAEQNLPLRLIPLPEGTLLSSGAGNLVIE